VHGGEFPLGPSWRSRAQAGGLCVRVGRLVGARVGGGCAAASSASWVRAGGCACAACADPCGGAVAVLRALRVGRGGSRAARDGRCRARCVEAACTPGAGGIAYGVGWA